MTAARSRKKPNKTGRDDVTGHDHFTILVRTTMETPAWQAMSCVAQALYPWLKLEWKGARANNNGSIRLSVRQAAKRLGVSNDTAAKAFRELQAKGFLVVREPAVLGMEGHAKSPAFEITEIVTAPLERPKRLFETWKAGADFDIQRANVYNPLGLNGKRKTRPQNHDGTVLNFRTY